MAIYGIGNSKIRLMIAQNGKVFDVRVKDTITITREINAPSRLNCTILSDENFGPQLGNVVAFNLDDMHNQFYGYIISISKTLEWCTIEAYDQLYYMNRNKMRFTYENLTATEVLDRIVKKRQYGYLDPPSYENTEYKIPLRIEENVSDLTIITTALDLTYQNTGRRYYIWDDFGSITLSSEWWLAGEPLLIVQMGYIEDYAYTETLDDRWTAVRIERVLEEGGQTENIVIEQNDKKIETYVARNQEFLMRYGYLEDFEQAESNENLMNRAEQILRTSLPPGRNLSLTGVQGDITVRGGTPILVDFFTRDRKEYIRGWFRTTSVTHIFENKYHTMNIECELINDMIDQWDNTLDDYFSPTNVDSHTQDIVNYPTLGGHRVDLIHNNPGYDNITRGDPDSEDYYRPIKDIGKQP